MSADLSRIRSNPLSDYAGVELKQGGVLLDADFNELVAIADRRFRALASDVLGRSTVSSTTPDAFRITLSGGTLSIGKGRLYVDGLLAENHGAPSNDAAKKLFDPLLAETTYADPILYTAQPFFPSAPALPTSGKHLVYLDVWQREVTHIEQPNLVEVAVGVETSSRSQTVWQVRVHAADSGSATCDTPDDQLTGWSTAIAPSTGRLTTGTFEGPASDDPCELPPTGGYTGLENQTYRVEIHDPGQPGGLATFKWSRDNASVATRVTSVISTGELELPSLGRDDVLRFNTGDWVEITDDVREATQRCGEMRLVTVDEAARRITFSPALPAEMAPATFPNSDFPRDRNLRVKRWDQKHQVLAAGSGGTTSVLQDLDAGTTGVIKVPAAGTTVILEKGVTVAFSSTGSKGFRAGDYWVFAARTADASVEALTAEPPRGIHHHYERLGIWDVGAGTVTDCRHPWPPPATQGHDCSCTACVTEQSHANGTFTLQDAVNKVRDTGGTVCIGPGRYPLPKPVIVSGARAIRIRGQGAATILVAPGSAFDVKTSFGIAVENLAIVSLGQAPAIAARSVIGLALRELMIVVTETKGARDAAIALSGVIAAASIERNAIAAPIAVLADTDEKTGGGFLLAAALAIDDNLFSCADSAVALDGRVLHLLATRVCGNQMLGCRGTAVSALGLGAPGSSLTVSANSIVVPGHGIRCGVDGLLVADNKLTNTGTAAAASRIRTIGIALANGLDRDGASEAQILANQIDGYTAAGIAIGSPVSELIVKLNIIERCGNGIVGIDDAKSASIAVENNQLSDIGPPGEESTPLVTGISIVRADTATVAGNTIRRVGVRTIQGVLRAGIVGVGVLNARVNGNDASAIGPPQEFAGLAAGIMLRGPYTAFSVHHNRVERDAGLVDGAAGAWAALVAAESAPNDTVSQATGGSQIKLDANRVLVLGGSPYIRQTSAAGAQAAGSTGARASVLGNELNARGIAPAVDLDAAGECLFSDNRVELLGSTRFAAVRVNTQAAIISANRVRGGETASIQVLNAKSAAVLGNITSAGIDVPGGLQPPWDQLNLRA
jgi:hypothetical protein